MTSESPESPESPESGPPDATGEAGEADARSLVARRRRRRRVRHAIGWLVFLLVAGGILYAAWSAVGGTDSSDDDFRAAASTTTSTTTPLPSVGPFKTNDGVNVRVGPSTTAAVVGLLELGTDVLVHCAVQGDPVTTPGGTQTIWVRISSGTLTGYVNASFVDTGKVLGDPEKIPDCPPG